MPIMSLEQAAGVAQAPEQAGLEPSQSVAVPGKRMMSLEQAAGLPQAEPSFLGFLKDPQSWKDVGKQWSAVGDLVLGMPAFLAGVGATGLADAYHAVVGTDQPMKAANADMKKVMETPFMRFLSAPLATYMEKADVISKAVRGKTIFDHNPEETTVGQVMGGLEGALNNAAEYWSEKTGSTETGEALKQSTQIAMAKGGAEFVKGFREWALKNKKIVAPTVEPPKGQTPEAKAAAGTVGEYTDLLKGKLDDGKPAAGAPGAGKPGEGPTAAADTPPGLRPDNAGDNLDPYRVPSTLRVDDSGNITTKAGAIVSKLKDVLPENTKMMLALAGVSGAAAYALSDQMTDEQRLAIGMSPSMLLTMRLLKGAKEPQLIEGLKAGGDLREAAAAEIYTNEAPKLLRQLRKFEKQGVPIEDVVQRTMEKGLRAIEKGQFKGGSAIGTYLYRIAENEAKGHFRREKYQPRTESLDAMPGEGRPGFEGAKGDAEGPSPHEQIADPNAPPPDMKMQQGHLAAKMSAALDKLPENFRRPFELRELEGLDYAEIAERLGQPINTVRTQIHRAKEALQGHLREFAKNGMVLPLVVGGLVVAAASQMDEEDRGLAALGLAGAIKRKGGMWDPRTFNMLTHRLETRMRANYGVDDPVGHAVGDQAKRMISGYFNKHAGTATDPLKDVRLPDGQTWGAAMNKAVQSVSGEGIRGARPDETIYRIDRNVNAGATAIKNQLSHVGDYLAARVPPEKLPQYDLVRAVKETAKWDEDMARKAEKERAREGSAELERMKTMPVEKEWPDGMKLVRLKRPGEFAHESTVMGHSVRGYEPPGKSAGTPDYLYKDAKSPHPDWIPESEKGLPPGQGSSGRPSYNHGGWEAIKSGDAEVYSLRGKDGQSHVTIEVSRKEAPKSTAERWAEYTAARKQGPVGDYSEWMKATHPDEVPGSVTQIKGRGTLGKDVNGVVPERYQQHVADWLNSREWGDVNLDQSGLKDTAEGIDGFSLSKKAPARYMPPSAFEDWARKIGDMPPKASWPPSQRGFASTETLAALAAITGGASLGAFLSEDHPLRSALYGALAGGILATGQGRKLLKDAIKSPDKYVGLISTRLGNIAPELKAQMRTHELRTMKALDTVHDQVTPFLDTLRKQSSGVQELVARGIMNRDLSALKGVPELAKTYPKVQATLRVIGDQLKALGRFAEGLGEYFPRIVIDYDGLKKAIGQKYAEGLNAALAKAEAEMIRKKGRSLTDVEQSLVTNRYLFKEAPTSGLPGYANPRNIHEVTAKLQPFYASPAESLLRYITGAITDIETARFFGRDIKTNAQGQKKFTNVDDSIGNLTARLLDSKKITVEQAQEVREILQARFGPGNKGMNTTLGTLRDATNAALLGNVTAAATQMGDSLLSIYHFGLTPTLQGLVTKLRGASVVTPKDLGLVNHVAEELAGKSPVASVLQKSLKYTGFVAIDQFAKGLSINAALAKAKGQAGTAKGQIALAERYGYAFEGEMPQLIADLRAGANTSRTQRLAFEALSDTQPISRAELPQAYLEHPNGRLLYQLKTYMLKQADVVRRDSFAEIASGKPTRMMKGLKNLAAIAGIYAVSNVPGDVVKDWLSDREIDPFSTPKLVENVLQTFGMNRYASERLSQGKIVDTARDMITPPLSIIEDIALGRDKVITYVPGAGRIVYDRYFDGNNKREISEKRLANKGLERGTGAQLSDNAKDYLARKRDERKALKEKLDGTR